MSGRSCRRRRSRTPTPESTTRSWTGRRGATGTHGPQRKPSRRWWIATRRRHASLRANRGTRRTKPPPRPARPRRIRRTTSASRSASGSAAPAAARRRRPPGWPSGSHRTSWRAGAAETIATPPRTHSETRRLRPPRTETWSAATRRNRHRACQSGERRPPHHDAREDATRADTVAHHARRDFEETVGQREHARHPSPPDRVDAQVLLHARSGHRDADPIDIGDGEQQDEQTDDTATVPQALGKMLDCVTAAT